LGKEKDSRGIDAVEKIWELERKNWEGLAKD